MTQKFIPPAKIHITSDDTIIQLVQVMPKNKNLKDDVFVYEYIQAHVKSGKLGRKLECSQAMIEKQLGNFWVQLIDK